MTLVARLTGTATTVGVGSAFAHQGDIAKIVELVGPNQIRLRWDSDVAHAKRHGVKPARTTVYDSQLFGIEVVHEDEPDEDYPVGQIMDCYQCPTTPDRDVDGMPSHKRRCTGLGPVVNRADPTQSYQLECGHLAI